MADQGTIFALSSGHGPAGVAVIRISGPVSGRVLERMAGGIPAPRAAVFRRVRHPDSGEVLDEGLVLWFPGPKSETGEDMAELQVHGGRAVVAAIFAALGRIDGCRLAEPGEFARRGFENGKIDLTVAEAIADLVDAETEAQRRQALRQAGGALARLYDGWRSEIIQAQALTEAAIDFSDEADVGAKAIHGARELAARLAPAIRLHLDDGRRGEIVREGFRVTIAGATNVGKSSLLNALARREAAIVSEEAGTTRDIIEVTMNLGGLPVVLSDTAGMRDTSGTVEREGIRRAVARAREADLVLWLMDATEPQAGLPPDLAARAGDTLWVLNKMDLPEAQRAPVKIQPGWLPLSVRTGQGLAELAQAVEARAQASAGTSESPALTQARHRQQLELCLAALEAYLAGAPNELELRAEDLRQAATALGRITGRVDVEDVLGEIFGRFCIGK
jgi:tRNA modification GTPase